mmetsp:Transcript_31762/g.37299  ORF Transcript_31762/g.37299 Transcript_31762/m.37299 type:complete len:100 (-) Transcript_31762:149-448(-)
MMAYFVKHSYTNGSEDDKKFSHFLLQNLGKGVLITNAMLVAFYLSRFRTYRNSNLARMHIPATLFGTYSAITGTQLLFFSYIFDSAELSQRYALRDIYV